MSLSEEGQQLNSEMQMFFMQMASVKNKTHTRTGRKAYFVLC